jgi:hypothetical protein
MASIIASDEGTDRQNGVAGQGQAPRNAEPHRKVLDLSNAAGFTVVLEPGRGHMNESVPFVARRLTRKRHLEYAVPPAVVFPLHGFREELAWAVGWEPQMVFPLDGEPAGGVVFTVRRGGCDEVWLLTTWDTNGGRAAYVRVTPGRDVTDVRIRVSGPELGPTHVDVVYMWTGLSADGNAFVEAHTEDGFSQWMDEWEEVMAHYLRAGMKLKQATTADGPA